MHLADLVLLLSHSQPQEPAKCKCAVSALVISHSRCKTDSNDGTTRVQQSAGGCLH